MHSNSVVFTTAVIATLKTKDISVAALPVVAKLPYPGSGPYLTTHFP